MKKARQLFNFFVRCYPPGSVLPSSTICRMRIDMPWMTIRIRQNDADPNGSASTTQSLTCHVRTACLLKQLSPVHPTYGVYFALLLLTFFPTIFFLSLHACLFGVQRLDFGSLLLGSELLHTGTSELEHSPAYREGKIFKSALSLAGVNHHPAF